jgi:uncharacterized membrane protein
MTTELSLIKFLHIVAGMLMVGGIVAFLLLILRARGASDQSYARATTGGAVLLNRALVIPGGGLAGILGFLLMLRYDQEGIFDAGRQGWIHISILLWIVALGIAGVLSMMTRRAVASGSDSAVREALSNGAVTVLIWVNVAVAVAIVYFMVFQPFVGGS